MFPIILFFNFIALFTYSFIQPWYFAIPIAVIAFINLLMFSIFIHNEYRKWINNDVDDLIMIKDLFSWYSSKKIQDHYLWRLVRIYCVKSQNKLKKILKLSVLKYSEN